MHSRPSQAMEQLQLAAKLADLKDEHYKTLLALSAVIELLIDKGLITREELHLRAEELDTQLESLISASVLPSM